MFVIFLRTLAIFLLMLAGFVLRRRGMLDDVFNRSLSHLLIQFFYPALILSSIVQNFSLVELARQWILPAGVFAIFSLGWLAGRLSLRLLARQEERTQRCFHFLCTVNNYSFLPIMLILSLWGEAGVAKVVFASLGAELFIWTLGIQALSGQRVSLAALRHLISMPMIALATAIGVVGARTAFNVQGIDLATTAPPLQAILDMLLDTSRMAGQATVPVSAIICGSRMASLQARHLATPTLAGLNLLRLAVIPALSISLLYFIPMPIEAKRVLYVIAIQPVSMSSVSMAECYDGDAGFASAAVLSTHLLGLMTIPLWLNLLHNAI